MRFRALGSRLVQRLALAARDIQQATPRTRIITLDLGAHAFRFRAGQALHVGLAGSEVRRPYSIACSPTQSRQTNTLELLVQIDDHVAPDPHLERAVRDSTLHIDGPFGDFGVPTPIPEQHLLFIAGGTGIAPLRSILWETLEQQPAVHVGLVYSARSPEEFAFFEELRQLASAGRIDLRLTITRDTHSGWRGERGRIDESLIRDVLKTVDTRCLVCGPTTLVAHATTLLKAVGVSEERILTESHV